MIWSHREWHGGFRGRDGYRGHALVEGSYMSHLSLELERLAKSAPHEPEGGDAPLEPESGGVRPLGPEGGGADSRSRSHSHIRSRSHSCNMVRRVDYEWFASARNCEPLVRALVDWLGWVAPSDLTTMCARLPFHASTKVANWSEEEARWLDALEASKRRGGEWRAYYDDGMRLLDLD